MSRLLSFLRAKRASWRGTSLVRSPYWSSRHDSIYLQHVYFLARIVGREAKRVIDIGSNNCPYLDWFDWIPRKVSLDLNSPYRSGTVEGIQDEFVATPIPESFDLCLCLQVLEHSPEAEPFALKLLGFAPHLIVSVPYKWPAGFREHIHDPVDAEKLNSWFGLAPNYQIVTTEPFRDAPRLVCYFDRDHPDRRISNDEIGARRPSRLL